MSAYVRLEDRLERELSVAPSRADAPAAGRDPRGCRTAARNRDGDTSRPARLRQAAPLAGRDAELRRLTRREPARSCSPASRGSARPGCWPKPARILHQRRRTVLYGRCYEEQVAPYEPFAEALGADAFAQLLGDAQRRALAAVRGDRRARRGHGAAARRPALGRRRHAAAARAPPAPPEAAGRARRVPRHARSRRDPSARRRRSPTCAARPGRARAAARARRDARWRRSSADADARPPRLHRETGGNPFFVEQVLASQDDEADPGGRQGRDRPPARHGWRRRPAACSSVAAVAGHEFDLAVLEAVLGERRARRARGGGGGADGPRGAPGPVRVRPRADPRDALRRAQPHPPRPHARRARRGARPHARRTSPTTSCRRTRQAPRETRARRGRARRCARSPTRRRRALCERALERHREGRLRAELYLALGEAQLRAGETGA